MLMLVVILLWCAKGMSMEEEHSPPHHIRRPLLRAVYQKMMHDEKHRNDNHEYWYTINSSRLSESVCEKALQFYQDKETSDFLSSSYEKSDWLFTQISHSVAKSVLSWFMTSTSINGLLKRGSMFVFSDDQLRQLLQIPADYKGGNMIDLGAGDGVVTEKMAKYYETVHATEASAPMVWRLQEKGYKVLGLQEWGNGSRSYDLIGCLNLLDRCDKPITLLHTMKKTLTPGTGRAIIAIVFPFKPYVEYGSADHKPTECLIIQGDTFEEQCESFIKAALEPAGFEVEKFTRLPYLCEGDLHQSFYVLSDAVFVVKLRDAG